MTKSDFIDWKKNPVTQELFSQLKQRVEDMKDRLVGYAASGNATSSAHMAGIVEGFQFLLNIDWEDTNGN